MEHASTLVIQEHGTPMANSKDIAAHFEKRHDHVMRDIDGLKKDLPNFGEMFVETKIADKYNRQQRAYLMNRDGFSLLAMGFTGKAALEWKVKYIEAFNAMEASLRERALALPQDYPSALRALADAEEQRLALAAKIEADAPAVRFADAITGADTNILIRDMAKILAQNGYITGGNRFYATLRNDGYLIKDGSDYNMPTQRSMELGLFFVKETPRITKEGAVIDRTPKVTPKGQKYFLNRYTAAIAGGRGNA